MVVAADWAVRLSIGLFHRHHATAIGIGTSSALNQPNYAPPPAKSVRSPVCRGSTLQILARLAESWNFDLG